MTFINMGLSCGTPDNGTSSLVLLTLQPPVQLTVSCSDWVSTMQACAQHYYIPAVFLWSSLS